MSLPAAWVDRIFEKLTLVYGQPFLRRWAELDLGKVKADWAHELRAFAQSPSAIAYGLEHLPAEGQPPTALQFRQLCQAGLQPPVQRALPQPKPDPQRVAAALAQLDLQRPQPRDPKAWAWTLREREQRDPKRLTAAQRAMWRAALEVDIARQQRIDEEVEA